MSRSKLLVRFRMATSIDDLKSVFFWRSVIAEALGTLLLVFVGCGSCLSWEDPNRIPKSDYNLTFAVTRRKDRKNQNKCDHELHSKGSPHFHFIIQHGVA
jgi:hypothetical protein